MEYNNWQGGTGIIVPMHQGHLQQIHQQFEYLRVKVKEYEEIIQKQNVRLGNVENEKEELKLRIEAKDSEIRNLQTQRRRPKKAANNNGSGAGLKADEGLNSFCSPLEIFPLEIWEKVFENVTNSGDLTACLKVSSAWGSLLASRKTTFLFPEVIPIIARTLQKQDLLRCRLVSQEWRHSIDSFLQNHPSHYRVTSLWLYDEHLGNETNEIISWLRYAYEFRNPVDIQHFLRHAKRHPHNNPFITRRIHIKDEYRMVTDCEEFWDAMTDLLNVFGDHVWHASFDIDSPKLQSYRYSRLQSCLPLMPNLKTVWIYSSHLIQMRNLQQS